MNDTNTTENEPLETAQESAPVEQTAEIVRAEAVNPEEALPEALNQSRAGAVRREHPAGEAFFRGSAEEVTDAEAEEMARKQLERSGLLRGQKVRVAD